MNARAIAFIACRLLAIYLMITYVLHFFVEIAAYFLSGQVDMAMPLFWQVMSGLALGVGVYAVVAAFFWFGASMISRSLSRPFPEKFTGDMDFDRWHALVIAAIGAMALLTSAQIFGSAIKSFSTDNAWSSGALRGGAFFLVAGLLLVILPRSILSALNAVRRWGSKSAIGDKAQ